MINSIINANLITPRSVVALSVDNDSQVSSRSSQSSKPIEFQAERYIQAQQALRNSQQSSNNGFFGEVAGFFNKILSSEAPTQSFFF